MRKSKGNDVSANSERQMPGTSDTISRQAAFHAITSYGGVVDKSVAKRLLLQLPSAQPERKKGKWVGSKEYCNHLTEEAKRKGRTERYIPSGMNIGVYCDQCWGIITQKSDYCPNCGADMRGEVKND